MVPVDRFTATATEVMRELARRQAEENLRFVGVPTSEATAHFARSLGIRLVELDDVSSLDISIDGADEVDGNFHLIKGRGGALLREKIVSAAARISSFVTVLLITRRSRSDPVSGAMVIVRSPLRRSSSTIVGVRSSSRSEAGLML